MEIPSWPSGAVRFDGETFEYGGGELHRVPVGNLLSIEVKPPKAGRLSLNFRYRAGLDTVKTGAWIEQQHAQDLAAFVAAIQAAMAGPA